MPLPLPAVLLAIRKAMHMKLVKRSVNDDALGSLDRTLARDVPAIYRSLGFGNDSPIFPLEQHLETGIASSPQGILTACVCSIPQFVCHALLLHFKSSAAQCSISRRICYTVQHIGRDASHERQAASKELTASWRFLWENAP